MTELSPGDFSAFFEAVHGHPPFPWQRRLAGRVAAVGAWPDVLDLPTGSGKTAAIDVAVFHLALEADRGARRKAPVRIAFVVDRRLVVDDAFTRAQKVENALAWSLLDEADATEARALLLEKAPDGVGSFDRVRAAPVVARVAGQLGKLAEKPGRPLIARRLRGGIPREDDWARTPTQPTVLCSTVDQVGSRLLFRGYGVSDAAKPIHAGLIGADCLVLLDEAHLAEPFRQTLGWVATYRGRNWRERDAASPWAVSHLTATPGEEAEDGLRLEAEDEADPILAARLRAPKPVRLVAPAKAKDQGATSVDDEDEAAGEGEADRRRRVAALADETVEAIAALRADGIANPAVAVVVNRVARARQVFERLRRDIPEAVIEGEGPPDDAEAGKRPRLILMIGPARPIDRDGLAEQLEPIRTRVWKEGSSPRTLDRAFVVVATQCIEAGVDIDLDGLVTEPAPLDALRQRFGRLNRAGRDILPYAAIVAAKSDLSSRYEDPVYEKTIKPTWDYLSAVAVPSETKGEPTTVDFGIKALEAKLAENPPPEEAISRKPDAPVLLPAHLDLLSQTAPVPAADPEVALYLHGPQRGAASVSVVWRADLDPDVQDADAVRRLLLLMPPRSAEAIELPVWAVRNWLSGRQPTRGDDPLADVPEIASEEEAGVRRTSLAPKGPVFRWVGDDDRSAWIEPGGIHAGDTIVVPAGYGGVDEFGWKPEASGPAIDVADQAADAFAGRRFVVRVAPGLLTEPVAGETTEEREEREKQKGAALAESLATSTHRWGDLREAAKGIGLPARLVELLDKLDGATKGKRAVRVDLDCYGEDGEPPGGLVFVAPFGIKEERQDEDGRPGATEDDVAGSMPGFPLRLDVHCDDVARKAEAFARSSGLPEDRIADLTLAGALHDLGKADPRFQALLAHEDPLGVPPDRALAKSAHRAPRGFGARLGLPKRWRHEALSVRLALLHPRLAEAKDRDLALWLIGTHHGHGRPWFPHPDDSWSHIDLPPALGGRIDIPPGRAGPQSLAFDWDGLDWPQLYERLKARYGVWELARMEAILRLADHRASEDAEKRGTETDAEDAGEKAA